MAVIKLVPRNSSFPKGYTVVDQDNIYSDTDSDTYCYISSPSSSNGTIWLYDFNTEDIPFSSIKEVNSITVKIKARNTGVTCNIAKNGTSTPSYGNVMVPNTVSVYTFDDVTLTIDDIDSLGPYLAIKVPVYRSSYSTVRIYGAEILIDYTPLYNKVEYGDKTLIDLTADTVTPSSLLQGYTAHDNTGALITGTATGGGTGAVSVVDTTDTHGGTIRTITAVDISDTTAVASDVASGKFFYTADGTKTEGTSTGGGAGEWEYIGKDAVLKDTLSRACTLDELNWTPSTSISYLYSFPRTEISINNDQNLYIIAKYIFLPVYQDGTVLNKAVYKGIGNMLRAEYEGPSTISNWTGGTTKSLTATNDSCRTFYVDSSGANSVVNAKYGIFLSISSPTRSISSTIKTYVYGTDSFRICGQCSTGSYYTTEMANNLDMAKSSFKVNMKFYAVPKNANFYQLLMDEFVDIYTSEDVV